MSRPRSGGFGEAFDPMAMLASAKYKRTTPEKFWARVRGAPDACWPWPGRRAPEGYGFVSWCWRDIGTHRLAYALTYRPIERGEVVRHSCDNPPCCNPAHLIVGTIADNNEDMHARGRAYVPSPSLGTSNFNAKLNDDLVRALRADWRAGETIKSICHRTGLSVGTIHPMLHGRTWRHVGDVAAVPSVASLQEAS
jgi:hypothetical protein